MKTISSLWIIFISFLIFPSNIFAQESLEDKFEKVDKLFERWDNSDSPGAAVGIIKDGELIYSRGYGMANLEEQLPNTGTSVFNIASMSKQFTASCIAILALHGELSLDDKLIKFFPDFPSFYKLVTIRHMIHHIHGIKDYFSLFHKAGKRDNDYFSLEEVIQLLKNQTSLYFPPGKQYIYSNSNYVLLGEIVKKVSGKSLRQFAHENIFVPLGMKNTHYHDDNTEYVENRAVGYRQDSNGIHIAETPLEIVGDGGVFTTIEDLFFWDKVIYSDVLGEGYTDLVSSVGVLNNGTKTNYAFGLFIDEYKGKKIISHAGTELGHRSEMMRFPDQKFTVICLTNRRRIDPTTYCKRIADIFLK